MVFLSARGGYFRLDVRTGQVTSTRVAGHEDTDFTAIARRSDGRLVLGSADGAVYTLNSDAAVAASVKIFARVDVLVTQGNTAVVLDRGQTSVTTIDPDGSSAQHALRAGEGATTMAADPVGRVLVADTRGGSLLVFGTDPLMMRQSYPVRNAPYGLVGTRTLAWVSLTASNVVVGYDLATGIPVERVRYPTVRQPDVLAFDDATEHPVRGVRQRRRHPGDRQRGAAAVTLAGWDVDESDDYEWVPLRLPPDVTRLSRLDPTVDRGGIPRLGVDAGAALHRRQPTSSVAAQENWASQRPAGVVVLYRALRPALFALPAEQIHTWAFAALRAATATGLPAAGAASAAGPARPGTGQHRVRRPLPRSPRPGRRLRQGRHRAEHLGRSGLRLRRGRHRHRSPAARKPSAAAVPAARRPRTAEPDGVQQPRRR